MRRIIQKNAKAVAEVIDYRSSLVLTVGIATFFFGFFAGAVFNLYLIAIHSPIIAEFRTSLTYQSAIFGDGILLPLVNMIAASFLLRHFYLVRRKTLQQALLSGGVVTAYFHITQAMQGLVNWAMPIPWHWNLLGLWHAGYMFSVCSFLSLFYLVLMKLVYQERSLAKEAVLVTAGIILFFFLLRMDYITVSFSQLLLR